MRSSGATSTRVRAATRIAALLAMISADFPTKAVSNVSSGNSTFSSRSRSSLVQM
jgi:hypothetical protein